VIVFAARIPARLVQAARARRIRDGVSSASNVSHVSAETSNTFADRGCATGAVDAAATLSSAPVE
jgi:hypothetical protein